MSTKFDRYSDLIDELCNQQEVMRFKINSFNERSNAEDIIHYELLKLCSEYPEIEALLINRLICRKRNSCFNGMQGECPFNNVCYTFESGFQGCDRYVLRHPVEAHTIIQEYINKEGLEL